MTAPTWPGTPAEWDAERDRRANAILSQYGPMVSGFSEKYATATMPPRPVEPPFTCGECGLTDNSVFNIGGTHTRFAHASAAICREQLKRELRALRDGPTPQYEVCGWSRFDSSGKMFSTWSTESQAKNAQREYGGTAHAIYKRVDVERAK